MKVARSGATDRAHEVRRWKGVDERWGGRVERGRPRREQPRAPGRPRPLGPGLVLGLEMEADLRSWTVAGPPGESGTDWRFAVGPSVKATLARTGDVDLYGYGHASRGHHWFAPRESSSTGRLADDPELGLRLGVGLDWWVTDRISVGGLLGGRWMSDVDEAFREPSSRWEPLGFGLRVGFSF